MQQPLPLCGENLRGYKQLILGIMLGTLLTFQSLADQAYLERFNQYWDWSHHLPEVPSTDFINFIQGQTPLALKLRERWLYQLGQQKNWLLYAQYYQASQDTNLQCFSAIADFNLGKEEKAIQKARTIFLAGYSLPQVCDQLFALLKPQVFTSELLNQRVALALANRNLTLARYLLKQYKPARLSEDEALMKITAHPKAILHLPPSDLQGELYLYGLKRLVSSKHSTQAVVYWHNPQTKKMLSHAEQQAFIIYLALYKAMRDEPDASQWFSQIDPVNKLTAIRDWEIRLAIKKQQWAQVLHLIDQSTGKAEPVWQYWRARAMMALGQNEDAQKIYRKLAQNRHYYGFLAKLQLNQPLHFEEKTAAPNRELLQVYQPILTQAQQFWTHKEYRQSAQFLADFASELPHDEKIALIYWVFTHLKWYALGIYISKDAHLTDYLALRFPLPYQALINRNALNFKIPPALIYAIIRQESGFREAVVSPAGARGLMQVMPSTAAFIAKKNHTALKNKDELFLSTKNIYLGTAYLHYLARRYQNQFLLMAASYNAGPHQVAVWLEKSGPLPWDIWIETLPWFETRNYLKNIVSFYAVYQYRLGLKPDLEAILSQLR